MDNIIEKIMDEMQDDFILDVGRVKIKEYIDDDKTYNYGLSDGKIVVMSRIDYEFALYVIGKYKEFEMEYKDE